MDYELTATIFKALGDPKRVQILDILSCGEQCACDILAYFDFTQPTLSHHMKVLMQAGLVQSRKSGTWHHYSLSYPPFLRRYCKISVIVFVMRWQREMRHAQVIRKKKLRHNNNEKYCHSIFFGL